MWIEGIKEHGDASAFLVIFHYKLRHARALWEQFQVTVFPGKPRQQTTHWRLGSESLVTGSNNPLFPAAAGVNKIWQLTLILHKA